MPYDADSFKAGFALGRMLWRPPTIQEKMPVHWMLARENLVFGAWSNGNTCTLRGWDPDATAYVAAWSISGRMWTPVIASKTALTTIRVDGGNGVVGWGTFSGYYVYSVNGQTQAYTSNVYTYEYPAMSERDVIADMVKDLP